MQASSATFIQNSAQGKEEGRGQSIHLRFFSLTPRCVQRYFSAKIFEKSSSFSIIFASNSRENVKTKFRFNPIVQPQSCPPRMYTEITHSEGGVNYGR
jgi:hypothetical protein